MMSKKRVIRQLLAIVEADLESFVESHTFPRGDISTIDEGLWNIYVEYVHAIRNAKEVLNR